MAKLKLEKEWKLWLSVALFVIILIGWLFWISRPPTEGGRPLSRVSKIIDERTVLARGSGDTVRFRLIGIVVPQAQAKTAQDHLKKTLVDSWVRLEPLKDDPSGVKIGFIYLGGEDLVAQMVRQGLAQVDREETAFDIRPYIESEQEAKREARGLWKQALPEAHK
jgi:endonuclease YncB( thermonuclease family)